LIFEAPFAAGAFGKGELRFHYASPVARIYHVQRVCQQDFAIIFASANFTIYWFKNLNFSRKKNFCLPSSPLIKEAKAAAPDNPRLLWVLSSILWNTPSERGGGQAKAIEMLEKGLEESQKQKARTIDLLEPSWGEPELLMGLAWSNLNRGTPNLNAAERDARSALELIPYWHYVRDILMPQIRAAKAKPVLPGSR